MPRTAAIITRVAAGMMRRAAASVKSQDRGAPGRCVLSQKHPRDYKSRDDKEDVNPDVTAR